MKVARQKQYKAKAPDETIAYIRDILKQKVAVGVKEKFFEDKSGLFFSCRLILSNDWIEDYYLGTNGKGMSSEYSLASAYGELMERLQNNVIIDHFLEYGRIDFLEAIKNRYPSYYSKVRGNGAALKYRFAPDERKASSQAEIKSVIERYIRTADNQAVIDTAVNSDVTLVPFFDTANRAEALMPMELLSNNISTNGMCAGNTPQEAIIQGISEIFERYAIRLIYQHNLSLPAIPKDVFIGNDIYDRIIDLEQRDNLSIEIKDCSCGIDLPALGVLIIDKERMRYQFHVGADPSPVTALERSLTEIFQGRSEVRYLPIDIPYQTRLMHDVKLREREMNETFVVSAGTYPATIFSNSPSYAFNGFNDNMGKSDDTDLRIYMDKIEKMGKTLFVRDVSYLGFPTFQLYIPGMSELHNILSVSHFKATYNLRAPHFLTAHNLESASEMEIDKMLTFLKDDPENPVILRSLNLKDVWMTGEPHLIMSVLYFKTGDTKQALKSIEKAINKANVPGVRVFYQCIRDYIFATGQDDDTAVYDALRTVYPKMMLEQVIGCLTTDKLGDFFNVSKCFDCPSCNISDSCDYINLLIFAKKMEAVYEQNLPKQTELANIFG